MVRTIDIGNPIASLSDLVSLAMSGTEVILAEGDRPLVRLVPIEVSTGTRTPGLNLGAMIASDDFDTALPDTFWSGG